MKADDQLTSVAETLNIANEHGMAAEVVWSAMRHYEKYHKSEPETYSMKWALERALIEWDI